MPQEMSLDEFSAYASGAGGDNGGGDAPPRVIPASVQADRDAESLPILKSERASADNPEDQAALDREIGARKTTATPRTMSLEDFAKIGQKAEVPAATNPPPDPVSIPPSPIKKLALGTAREVATLGDMIIGLPGGVAASIGELGMQAEMSALGVSRDAGEKAAQEFGQYIASKSQPKVLSNLVANLAEKSGQPVTPGIIDGGMEKLNEWIDKGAQFIDTKTGHALTKAEVQSEANLLMNLVGVRGLGKVGPKIGGKPAEAVPGEAAPVEPTLDSGLPPTFFVGKDGVAKPTLDPVDGHPTPEAFEAMAQKMKTAQYPKVFSEKQLAKTSKAWQSFLDGRTTVEAAREARAETAKAQTGSADPKLLAAIGAGTAGYLLAEAYPEHRDEGIAAVLGAGMIGPKGAAEGMSIGSILKRGDNTLTTLERLNPNHTEFPKKRIEEELRRPDVTKAEKDVFKTALADVPDDGKVTAADLTQRIQDATGNFELKPQQTDEYADYGLNKIDRGGLDPYAEHPQAAIDQADAVLADPFMQERANAPPGQTYDDFPTTREQAQFYIERARVEREQALHDLEMMKKGAISDPITTIWQVGRETNAENHFNDPNYFAHSRSFHADGVKHVVEMQSDLVQKMPKPDASGIEARDAALAEYNKALQAQRAMLDTEGGISINDPAFRAATDRITLTRNAYYDSVQNARGADNAPLAPMWKDWYKRVAREELADSARKGDPAVRFATADTVAKVEGWPENDTRIVEAQRENERRFLEMEQDNVRRWEQTVQNMQDGPGRGGLPAAEGFLAEARQSLTQAEARVAEIEKPQPRFPKKYQGIYDRYKGDVEKFLKNLGGKEHTDASGHTWIEVPTGVKRFGTSFDAGPQGRAKMFGGATGDMMKTIAGLALGVTVANELDPENPLVTSVLGAIAGVAAAHLTTHGVSSAFKALTKPDTRIRINRLTEEHQVRIERMKREVAKFGIAATKLVPSKTRREAIHLAIDGGKIATLSGNDLKLAQEAQKFYATIATEAQKLGVLDLARADYSTHLWQDTVAARGLLERKQAAMSGRSGFNKKRLFLTMQDGINAGLKPRTIDIAEVVSIYGDSMGRTMANAKLLDDLHKAAGPAGEPLVMKTGRAPRDFVVIDSPQFRASRVHPDIAPSLKFLFEAESPGGIIAGINAVNIAIKRNAVSYSLFHAKSLVEAGLVAGHPLLATKVLAQSAFPKVFGENKMLKMVREGGVGDAPDKALVAGLKFSMQGAESVDIDVGGGFYKGMQVVQDMADKALPGGLGKGAVKTYIRLNHAVDNFMWARLHAALKLEVWMAKKEGLLENNAKAGTPISEAAAGRLAAKYTNDVFGGLNWQRLAESSKTKWGRNFALQLNSRSGRIGMNILLFAPDWTLSTMRAFYKTIPGLNKGTGLRGLLKPRNDVDLYRQQLLRFGLYYVTALNAINMMTSGKPIWENKDPTRIELSDGRSMQAAKHSFEAFHLMMEPRQALMNKMGTLPKEGVEQMMGVEYLNAKGRMPPMKSRLEHAAKMFVPIGAQQFSQGVGTGLSGMLGAPIYGRTKEQVRDAAKAAREARHKKLIEQYRKSHGLD